MVLFSMTILKKKVPKSEFKPKAFEYMRRVRETGQPLVITEHGKPVLKLIPYEEDRPQEILQTLRGKILDYQDPLLPVGAEDWLVS